MRLVNKNAAAVVSLQLSVWHVEIFQYKIQHIIVDNVIKMICPMGMCLVLELIPHL
ncbi:MAG TPA: hypothetical protein PLT51_00880 [Candidatus Dojkabacteria bacterium]|nr:hypothetical protein [Candidatus Dojkabacteria bacterium]